MLVVQYGLNGLLSHSDENPGSCVIMLEYRGYPRNTKPDSPPLLRHMLRAVIDYNEYACYQGLPCARYDRK